MLCTLQFSGIMQYKENLSAPVTHSQALNLLWAVLSEGLIAGESKLSYCSCGATFPSDSPSATLCNLWLLQQVKKAVQVQVQRLPPRSPALPRLPATIAGSSGQSGA